MVASKSDRLVAAEKALAQAQRLVKQRRKALDDATGEADRARDRLHDATIRELVGGQVKRRYRRYAHPELNAAIGTLVECRRTWALVDFGDAGRWNIRINELAPTDVDQGGELRF